MTFRPLVGNNGVPQPFPNANGRYHVAMVKFLALCFTATAFACSSDYPIWIPRSQSADSLYRFAKNGKAGYIDVAGHVVIPAILPLFGNSESEFHDGLLEIGASDGKYVDRT